MALHNKVRENWTAVPNGALRDSRLTLKDRGLYAYIVQLPDGWDFSIMGLAAVLPDGKAAIRASVNRLEELGYIERTQDRDEDGKLGRSDWIVHAEPSSDLPSSVSPSSDNRSTANRTQYNTKSSKDLKNTTKNKDLMPEAASGSDEQSLAPAKEIDSEAYEIVDHLDRLVARVVDREPRKRTEKQRRDAALDIERLHRIDGRSYEQISGIMRWALQDDFWRNNIQSTATLRKQFDKLYAKAKSEAEKRSQQVAVIS